MNPERVTGTQAQSRSFGALKRDALGRIRRVLIRLIGSWIDSALLRRRVPKFNGFSEGHGSVGTIQLGSNLNNSRKGDGTETEAYWNSLNSAWHSSFALSDRGFWHEGVKLRKELVSEAHAALGIADGHRFSFLNPDYAMAPGHLGELAMFAYGMDIGLVPRMRPSMLVHGNHVDNWNFVEALSHRFPVQVTNSASFNHRALFGDALLKSSRICPWAVMADRRISRTTAGLLSEYELWEIVGQKASKSENFTSPMQLEEKYVAYASAELHALGLGPDQPFVALHIRELPGGAVDHRSAPIENYLDAVQALIDTGVMVVRFGLEHMTPLPTQTGLLDLVRVRPGDRSLDLYVLQRASFLITTVSGPSALAAWLGTPQLVTNTTGIGKTTLTCPALTVYLPRKFESKKGHQYTLSEVLSHPVAYWEGYESAGVDYPIGYPNSKREVRNATMEMLDLLRLENPVATLQTEAVDRIRSDLGAVTFGPISKSFTSANPDWAR